MHPIEPNPQILPTRRLSFALANERGQMLALLTRSLGKGSLKAIRYIHHTPEGASSGLYPPVENLHPGMMHVNPDPPRGQGNRVKEFVTKG
jgi:hypothetical protein